MRVALLFVLVLVLASHALTTPARAACCRSTATITALPPTHPLLTTHYVSTHALLGSSFEIGTPPTFAANSSDYLYYSRLANFTGARTNASLGLHFRLGGNTCMANRPTDGSFTPFLAALAVGATTLNNTYTFCLNANWFPNQTAPLARRIKDLLGSQLVAFEFGNEPDGAGIPYETYLARYVDHRAAILAAVPDARFQLMASGWDAYATQFVANNISDFTQALFSVSMHMYPSGVSADQVMRNTFARGYSGTADRAHSFGVRWIFGESNVRSYNQQYAVALYALDQLLSACIGHADGFNFHGLGNGYAPLLTCGGAGTSYPQVRCANGHYYAQWIVAEVMREGAFVADVFTVDIVHAFQVVRNNRTVAIVVMNKQPVNATATVALTTELVVTATSAVRSAYVKWLLPPPLVRDTYNTSDMVWGLESRSGIRWGGQTLNNFTGQVDGVEVRENVTGVAQPVLRMPPYTAAVMFFEYDRAAVPSSSSVPSSSASGGASSSDAIASTSDGVRACGGGNVAQAAQLALVWSLPVLFALLMIVRTASLV